MIGAIPDGFGDLAAIGTQTLGTVQRFGWDERLAEVAAHGLAGLLGEARRRGDVELSSEAVAHLEDRLADEARLAVRLEAEVLRLRPLIDRYGAVVLKGPSLAHGAYPDPSWRPFTDIDLLVPAKSIAAMTERLVGCGYRRPLPDPSSAFTMKVGKATVLEHPCGLVIDLHRTLASGNLGARIDVDEIVSGRQVIEAGSVSVPAPGWPAHLVEVCLHAIVGDGLARGISLRDVVQVASHPDQSSEAVMRMAEGWDVAGAVAGALHHAHRALSVEVPASFAAWVTAELREDPMLAPAPASVRSARLRVDELRHGGLRRRAVLARALLLPSPAFLRWRYGRASVPILYWRRWQDLARRGREGSGAARHERRD